MDRDGLRAFLYFLIEFTLSEKKTDLHTTNKSFFPLEKIQIKATLKCG